MHPLQVIEELEEHDPGQHRQPIKVAIQPLVLPHDLARGLDDGIKALGRGLGSSGLRGAGHGIPYRLSGRIERFGQFRHRLTHGLWAAKQARDLARVAEVGNGLNFERLEARTTGQAPVAAYFSSRASITRRASSPYRWNRSGSLTRSRWARSVRVVNGAFQAR